MPSTPSEPESSYDVENQLLFKEILARLVCGDTLNEEEARRVFHTIMTGGADNAQIGALLSLIQMRGVTVEELAGAARVMRAFVTPVVIDEKLQSNIIDTCGTGGAPKTFNISTAAAIVAAGAGAKVAKHGNRSRTGRGSAEILQAFGVNIEAEPAVQSRCLDEVGVSFSFAVNHHPAVKFAMPARRALGFPTIFNLLGPLTNPAGATRQLIGVYHADFIEPMAEVLHRLGAKHALIVHGRDCLDEMTTTAPTLVSELKDDAVNSYEIDAREFGLMRSTLEDLKAESLDEAVSIMRFILDNQPGPKLDIVLLNAGAALLTADLAPNMEEGVAKARESVESGCAKETLEKLIQISNS